jgi:hypothetical protein
MLVLIIVASIGEVAAQARQHEERFCQWADMDTGWCRQGDVVLVTNPPSRTPLSESSESILIAVAVAQYCDFTKPIVVVGKSAVVCIYTGRKRETQKHP